MLKKSEEMERQIHTFGTALLALGLIIFTSPGAKAQNLARTFSVDDVSFTMRMIPRAMNATIGKKGNKNNPARQVNLSYYLMGETEVSRQLYFKVMFGEDPSMKNAGTLNPIDGVTWHKAAEFCNRLTMRIFGSDTKSYAYWCNANFTTPYFGDGEEVHLKLDAKGFRLPTEAEWEWAARGGENLSFPGTDESGIELSPYAWMQTNSAKWSHTSKVASGCHSPCAEKIPNDYMLYDMAGNVWEWCNDEYTEPDSTSGKPESVPEKTAVNPLTYSPKSTSHTIRGGGWDSFSPECEVTSRRGASERANNIGFRLVLCPAESEKAIDIRMREESVRLHTTQRTDGAKSYSKPILSYQIDTVHLNMRLIPGAENAIIGHFDIGNDMERKVNLDPFYMSEIAVNTILWKLVMRDKDLDWSKDYLSKPEYKKWNEVAIFCNKLTMRVLGANTREYAYWSDSSFTTPYFGGAPVVYVNLNTRGFRLPTEAEWDIAVRDGKTEAWFPQKAESSDLWYYGPIVRGATDNYRAYMEYKKELQSGKGKSNGEPKIKIGDNEIYNRNYGLRFKTDYYLNERRDEKKCDAITQSTTEWCNDSYVDLTEFILEQQVYGELRPFMEANAGPKFSWDTERLQLKWPFCLLVSASLRGKTDIVSSATEEVYARLAPYLAPERHSALRTLIDTRVKALCTEMDKTYPNPMVYSPSQKKKVSSDRLYRYKDHRSNFRVVCRP